MLITKRRLAVLAVLPALALSTACGAQSFAGTANSAAKVAAEPVQPSAVVSAEPATTPSGAATLSWHEAAVKFAGCMRENKIKIPDPVKGQDLDTSAVTDSTQAQLTAAMKACKEWDWVILGGGPTTPEEDAKFATWAKCLRENGVWQPIETDEQKPADFQEVKPKSGAWEKAQEKCASLAPPAPYEK
ncbi:hypothetical protein ACFYY8_29370 [Streptosporangium sp. NPDC001559]|uniref:hypothetical protein n=1 Tax=Streptosporangium sp. NPDC001559 TaxID=3366187 RepID=UPI0036E9D978